MSSRGDRRSAPPAWKDRTEEILELIARQQRHEEAEAALRAKYDARAELRSALRAWFAYEYLPKTDPEPGQRHDTMLGSKAGLTTLAKRSGVAHYYGRTSSIQREPGGTVITAAINCRQASPAAIRRAIEKLRKSQLRQMHNLDLKAAGIVVEAAVDSDGILDLTCLVSDPVAAAKVSERTYTGLLVSMDGDEISDVSLVDNPVEFVEKAAWGGRGEIVAKVYIREGKEMSKDWKLAKKMSKKNGLPRRKNYAALQRVNTLKAQSQRLWPSAQAVIGEQARVDALRQTGAADGLVVKALAGRVQQAYGVELVKAARARPVAAGNDGMAYWLRHGRL